MLWYRVMFHQVVDIAFVQRAHSFVYMVQLMFAASWMSPSPLKIVIVLVLDGAQDKDCVPDTTQGGQ